LDVSVIHDFSQDLRSSALAEHAELSEHHICLEDSKILARVDHFHHHKLREVIEIEKRLSTLNRTIDGR